MTDYWRALIEAVVHLWPLLLLIALVVAVGLITERYHR